MPADKDSATALDQLASAKYLLVTTYRKDGRTVPTPVWMVRDGDALGVWTVADSGKVKRIRNRGDVLLAPCDVRGNRRGEDVPGFAEVLDRDKAEYYRSLLVKKYGVIGWLTVQTSKLRRGRDGTVALRITVSGDAVAP